ncbi:MAG TPA: 50S ribosomal protein L3 [Burkholderiales bacterium]|nr:50S ribosomal protein L3 [Burkholderiales bacterium]
MLSGLIGRKLGMTQVADAQGRVRAVTVVQVGPCTVTQLKTDPTDGYDAVQVTWGRKKLSRVTSAERGHFKKANVAPGVRTVEFRKLADGELALGQAIAVTDVFKAGEQVDVQGVSKGHGYAGVIKRHHFSSNRASHGNSISHNRPGSTGMNQDPGRVFPGKRMAGHMGDAKRTAQNLRIVRIDAERQLLLVKGAVPGSDGGDVVVHPAAKAGA